jgi:hypothetical protein
MGECNNLCTPIFGQDVLKTNITLLIPVLATIFGFNRYKALAHKIWAKGPTYVHGQVYHRRLACKGKGEMLKRTRYGRM